MPKKNIRGAPAPTPPVAPRHRIVVGVDYGTTYSGVSYVTTDKKELDDINIITTWPGELSTSWKTPTRIAYMRENRNFDSNKWGFEVEPKHASYSWTKLLLDKNAKPNEFDDPSLATLKDEGMMQLPNFRTAPEVCEDYLRELYIYVSQKLKRQMGSATFEMTPMECWITLPAIWSEEAKDATLQAAKKAGFGSRYFDEVYTIAEPEAAAIATLKKYSEANAVNAIMPGENILICDCGGGTVDITTYTIVSVDPELTFDEICVGIGGKCGSTYIDRNLHSLLLDRFGDAFAAVPMGQKGPGSRFMAAFEKIKRSFGLNNDKGIREVYPLKMGAPDLIYYDEEERTVKLHYEDMKAIFDPVVKEIIRLVEQQVIDVIVKKKRVINRVILVGGFGDSAYLNQQLTKWCAENGPIQLVCPDHPQSAVIRGAALRGLEYIAPRSRQSRRHYGFSCGDVFREGIDDEDDSYPCAITGEKYCSGRMLWTIEKGEPILRETHRSFDLIHHHYPGSALKASFDLCCCNSDDAPEYLKDPAIEVVGRIVARLPHDFDYGSALQPRFNTTTNKICYAVSLQVQVVFGNKGDNLTYRTIVNGKVSGTANIEFGTASS